MAVLRVKEIMRDKGYSRERLAEEMDVSLTTITNINQEHTLPSVETLLKLADVLDVDVRDLFVPTKGGTVTQSNIDATKELLESAIKLLNGE